MLKEQLNMILHDLNSRKLNFTWSEAPAITRKEESWDGLALIQSSPSLVLISKPSTTLFWQSIVRKCLSIWGSRPSCSSVFSSRPLYLSKRKWFFAELRCSSMYLSRPKLCMIIVLTFMSNDIKFSVNDWTFLLQETEIQIYKSIFISSIFIRVLPFIKLKNCRYNRVMLLVIKLQNMLDLNLIFIKRWR